MRATLETINQMQRDCVIGRYAIGGAVGATFYLEPAATYDLDIFVDYLTNRGCQTRGEYIVVGDWPVQFLPAGNALEMEALEQAIQADVEGVKTWVMRAEHLVAIALRTGRTKDHARIALFLEQRAVDPDLLRSTLEKHGLLPTWQVFQKRYLNE